jgi:PAS domain S-box-containing protein
LSSASARAPGARAQEALDRIFPLSPDLIAVANFDGYFVRVNPAVEQVLGYTVEEFLARPYLEFIHPDDREATTTEAAAISDGKPTLTFTNRYVAKDGSLRILEWRDGPWVPAGREPRGRQMVDIEFHDVVFYDPVIDTLRGRSLWSRPVVANAPEPEDLCALHRAAAIRTTRTTPNSRPGRTAQEGRLA